MPLLIHDTLTPMVIETFCGKALDVASYAIHDGALIVQWDRHGDVNQRWYLDPCGAEEYRIIGRQSGRVLDMGGPVGAHAFIHAWAANSNQRWVLEDAGDGWVNIVLGINRTLCLDVGWASKDNGAGIYTWYRDGGAHQRFKITP